MPRSRPADDADDGGAGDVAVGAGDRAAEQEDRGRDGSDTVGGASARVQLPGRGRARKPATLSLQIRFETLQGEIALARLIESTVWVNDAHPAFRRAAATRAEAYHIALAVAAALAPLAVEPHEAQRFISAFLARWGAAAVGAKGG